MERPHLLRRLDRGLQAKLILVSASAGAGKSTVLASWLKQLARPSTWLSLDKSDNDFERFLLYLVRALQQVESTLGSGVPEVLQAQGSPTAELVLIRLINDIARLERDLVLVLDDYHVLANEKVHHAVEFLLDHLPPQLCLVIATRTDPPVALSRLRVQDQLLELRGEDLRFRLEETTQFLNGQLGLELSPAAIASLEARTEGWAAGLQLAALSLRGRRDKEDFVAAFTGSHRYLVDYLMDEVLDRQSEEVRRFLRQTSILNRFTASLCEAVTGQTAGAGVLEQLAAANLFLSPLDDEGRWYRYHHLFAEFLRHRLQEAEAAKIPELHQRASEWLEQEGWSDEAIEHALLAKDFGRAERLIEGLAAKLGIYGKNVQLIKYIEQLPRELLPSLPRLRMYYVWTLVNTGQVGTLATVLPIIERSWAHAQQSRGIPACPPILRAHQHVWQLDFAGAVGLCEQALALLEPSEEGSLSYTESSLYVGATALKAYCYLYSDPARADTFYPIALTLTQKLGDFVATINGFAGHGRIKHLLGQLHAALAVFEQGLGTIESWKLGEGPGHNVVNIGELYLNLAGLYYEWNRLDEADTQLQQAKVFNEQLQFPPVLALELETSFHLYCARGEIEAACSQLRKLDQMVNELHPDNLFHQQMFGVMAMNLRLWLAADIPTLKNHLLGEVAQWVEARGLDAGDSFDYPHEGGYHVLTRLLLAQGKPAEALPLLARLEQAAAADGRLDDKLRYLLLQTLAQQALAREARALETLQSALRLAEPEGYRRSFVDLGPAMQALLRKAAKRSDSPYIGGLLMAFPVAEPPMAPASTLNHETEGPATPDWLEPLNDREHTVLSLLAAGRSNKQIAKELRLSPNTVKWYIQGLYSKLGVGSRVQAVNRARGVGLL
jgi:LuxR family maltose regulon positive regulatory protein